MRKPSVGLPMLRGVSLMVCLGLLGYELVDLFHVSKYACGGYRYPVLPNFSTGTCRRVWDDFSVVPAGPHAVWNGVVIVVIVVLLWSLTRNDRSRENALSPRSVLYMVVSGAGMLLVVYEVLDLLHATKYACDGVVHVYLILPNVSGTTCHRVWEDWVLLPTGPLTRWEIVRLSCMAGVVVVAVVLVLLTAWRQKQIDWLLEAVIEQTERLILRTQYDVIVVASRKLSKDSFEELGSQLLMALTQARPSVAFEGNTAESAVKMALVHHEFVVARRDLFIQARVSARRVVAATLSVVNGSFSETWHEVLYAWYAYFDTKAFVPEMALLAKLVGLPTNPHSSTFKADVDAAVRREQRGFTLGTYLGVILPLKFALSRHDWRAEVKLTVEKNVSDPRRPGKTTTQVEVLRGEKAVEIMKDFLAVPYEEAVVDRVLKAPDRSSKRP